MRADALALAFSAAGIVVWLALVVAWLEDEAVARKRRAQMDAYSRKLQEQERRELQLKSLMSAGRPLATSDPRRTRIH